MLENILNVEALIDQYKKSSGEKCPSDLKTATLLRFAPQKIREYLHLTLCDDATYLDMKEALLSRERLTKGYSQESILKQLSTSGNSGHDGSEPTPMEVDRVIDKGGKGKHEGKGKKGGDGKGKGWWNNMWQFGGRGHGRGKGRGGSKSKGRGKGKSKGKKGGGKPNGKGKRKNSGGKGAKRHPCFVCGSYDHWSRECPRKVNNVNNVYYDWNGNEVNPDIILQNQQSQQPQSQSVKEVHQGQSSSSSTHAPTTSKSSTSYRSSAGGSAARRIYDLGLESNPFPAVRMVVDDGESKDNSTEGVDFFFEWFEFEGKYDIDSNLCVIVIDEDISLSPVSEPMSAHMFELLQQVCRNLRLKNLAVFLTQDQMLPCCQCHL